MGGGGRKPSYGLASHRGKKGSSNTPSNFMLQNSGEAPTVYASCGCSVNVPLPFLPLPYLCRWEIKGFKYM